MENKIIAIIVSNGDTEKHYIDTSFVNYFLRTRLSNELINASKEISKSLSTGKIHCIEFDKMTEEYEHLDSVMCTVCKNTTISVVILTKKYKHQRVIAELAHKLMMSYSQKNQVGQLNGGDGYTDLESIAKDYETPHMVDNIVKVQNELDKTIDVVHLTMDKMRMREKEINELVAKTTELEDAANVFAIRAKKLNSCCAIL